MSYSKQIEFQITPDESFKVIRNCSGCGTKAVFQNTNCFRVNANGRKIDVWLIYQCVKCKHTSNLSIYERKNPETIRKEEYDKFMRNSSELALRYGTDSQLFSKNRAEIDWSEIRYSFRLEDGALHEDGEVAEKGNHIVLRNRFMLKVRRDKVVSELLGVTRSRFRELEKSGVLTVKEDRSRHKIIVDVHGDIEVGIKDPR